jgi:hypothetical protein
MVFRVLTFAEVARCSWMLIPFPRCGTGVLPALVHSVSIGFKYTGGMSTGKAILMALLPILLAVCS